MNKRKLPRIAVMTVGAALMILAALLLFADLYGKKRAENDAEQALAFSIPFFPSRARA